MVEHMSEMHPALKLEIQAALSRLRRFCFPDGEKRARSIRTLKTTETGQIRMSPEARWIPFTAEQIIDSTQSDFRWEARLDPGKLSSPTVMDAYEEGRGHLLVKLGGLIPVRTVTGPDADRGELQRYLASLLLCPAMLLNHPSLELTAVGPFTLRVTDQSDSTAAAILLDISEHGRPLACRADRPRMVGKHAVVTPWLATGSEFREWEGMRVPGRLEVAWILAEGTFTYYRSEIISFAALHE
jgi:hypothetical protein